MEQNNKQTIDSAKFDSIKRQRYSFDAAILHTIPTIAQIIDSGGDGSSNLFSEINLKNIYFFFLFYLQ